MLSAEFQTQHLTRPIDARTDLVSHKKSLFGEGFCFYAKTDAKNCVFDEFQIEPFDLKICFDPYPENFTNL